MIKRIVKLTLREETLPDFFQLLADKKRAIRNFSGCLHLEIWQDKDDPRVVFTYSFWQKESDLDNYRHSDLFKETWKVTKTFFADKPLAHTVGMRDIVRR